MKVYTGGTFDIPHVGHVNFFRQIKNMWPDCTLIVSLNTDDFVEKYKGRRPLFNFDERSRFLYLTGYVDVVISNIGGEDSKPAIKTVNPEVIAIGNDWLEKDYCKQMGFTPQWLRDHYITLAYLPYTEGISTTELKERMKNAG